LAVGDGVTVAITYDWAPPSDALIDTFARAFVDARRATAHGGVAFDLGTSEVSFAWGRARARTLRTDEGIDARLVVVPACGGRMTIGLITSAAPMTRGHAIAERWIDTVRTKVDSPA